MTGQGLRHVNGDNDSTGGASLLASAVDQLGLGQPGMEFSLGDMLPTQSPPPPQERERTYTMGLGDLGCLDTRHLLLKGARLKSTPHVYGLAVYTGLETKVRSAVRLCNHALRTCEHLSTRM